MNDSEWDEMAADHSAATDADYTFEPASSDPDKSAKHDTDDAPILPQVVSTGTLDVVIQGERRIYGTPEFFERAAEELLLSTRYGVEFGGAVIAKKKGNRIILVGLQRKHTGQSGRVAIDGEWGSILWHTHPGLRGSLAAFSNEDLQVAQQTKKPLLVIGFASLSPDVLSTLTLPLGVRGMLLSSGVKALLSLEKKGRIPTNFLRIGTAARVCYPSGAVRPVIRLGASPLSAAAEDVSFLLDQGVGAVERAGQRAIRRLIRKFL